MASIAPAQKIAASSASRPVSADERIPQIDILRGLALAGVLLVNLLNEFRVSIFTQFVPGPPFTHATDRWIMTYSHVFIEMKAFALFSLLFGIGLAIQFERRRAIGPGVPVFALLLRLTYAAPQPMRRP